jgi:hypothetical protein
MMLKAKFAMQTVNIPMTQESSHIKITNQDNAHHFLQHQRYCSFEFIPKGQTIK